MAVVDPGCSGRSGGVGDTPKWEKQFGVSTLRQGTRQRGGEIRLAQVGARP